MVSDLPQPSSNSSSDETTIELRPVTTELLLALSDYRTSEQAMRMRTRVSMRMGASDLQALRFLLKANGEDRVVTSRDLASHLGMTSASVTTMLDRLTASGHIQREQHPTDRRSISIVATPGSDDEVRQTLGSMHHRLMDVAEKLPAADALVIRDFL
ncbi:MAG: MarR family transcriptional regulator, partial [Glaciihabitans sp.]|nr:MarR family transcriptional regulator [Glaciihabitans sp.]